MRYKTIKKKNNTRINQRITATTLRVIGEDKEQLGIMDREKALALAQKDNLDLVEISPTAKPPVCRIMNFGKFQYQLKKQANAAKKKQKRIQVKVVKFRPGTEEADYQVKLKNVLRFLEQGDKVKVVIWFRGREMVHQNLGLEVLERIKQETNGMAVVEQEARIEGRQLGIILSPHTKKTKSAQMDAAVQEN